jgi:hypothetical protein
MLSLPTEDDVFALDCSGVQFGAVFLVLVQLICFCAVKSTKLICALQLQREFCVWPAVGIRRYLWISFRWFFWYCRCALVKICLLPEVQ